METFERFTRELYPSNDEAFGEIALRLFHFQSTHNEVYRNYLAYIGVSPANVTQIADIPFLPITLFKTSDVRTGHWTPEVTYLSSATTGATVSRHSMPSKEFYFRHSQRIFESIYGSLSKYKVLCLLPSYLDRTGSSLVAMASHFITQSGTPDSGFFLNDIDRLVKQLEVPVDGRTPLLLGVSFALLDLAEQHEIDLARCVVMETGGMKGRRPEITRAELHGILKARLNVDQIHSEYGMTELTSQAYAPADGAFECPASMRVYFRELNDPFAPLNSPSGVINIIDLANAHSCSFIETQDLGKGLLDGHFEVVGRMDASDARGCNLLVE